MTLVAGLSLHKFNQNHDLAPDLNPIEDFLTKLKALLRKAARLTTEALWEEIANLLESIPPEECSSYFAAAGYINT